MSTIEEILNRSESVESALQSLSELTSETFLEGASKSILQGLEIGEALGRSYLVELDAQHAAPGGQVIRGKAFDGEWIVCDDAVRISFDLIPEEALQILRFRSFTIAGLEHDALIEEVRQKMLQAVREGMTVDMFKKRVAEIFDEFKVARLEGNRLQTIYRTNMFTAYSVGQLGQAVDMKDRFPYWRYSAIKDNRTRMSHRELDGRIFRTGEGPIPPIDYNCRCTAIYVHASQAGGLKPATWDDQAAIVKFDTVNEFSEWALSRLESLSPNTRAWLEEQTSGT